MKLASKVVLAGLAVAALATSAHATDVYNRVIESGQSGHTGVLVYVSDGSKATKSEEHKFFGKGLQQVKEAAPDFFVQIVEPNDVPGGALPGSWVILTSNGDRPVAFQRGYTRMNDLRAFVATGRDALKTFEHRFSSLPAPLFTGNALLAAK